MLLGFLLLAAGAAASAATGDAPVPSPAGAAALPAPHFVVYGAPGANATVVSGIFDINRATAAERSKLKEIKVKHGAVSTAKNRPCSYPLNQVYFTTDNTSKLVDMWTGSFSFNSYTFGRGTAAGGRNGPGVNGAACARPPLWGPTFQVLGRCTRPTTAPPPQEEGMVQMALYNVYFDNADRAQAWGAVTFLVSAKYYLASAADGGGIERQELVAQYWSPERGFITTGGPNGDGKYPLAFGRAVADLTGSQAVLFEAPEGRVLGEYLPGKCLKQSKLAPQGRLLKVKQACAMTPSWYPTSARFQSVAQAEMFGYQCTGGAGQ